jgi:hypothetical protein
MVSRSYKEASLYRQYALTFKTMAAMYDEQNGQCAICECGLRCPDYLTSLVSYPREKGRECAIDHDHEDDLQKVRAILCSQCNTAIGMLQESPKILARAIVYLEAHGKTW